MRISCQSSSEFYNPHIARGVNCFVDGELLEHCVEASEEEGWALASVRTPDGKPVYRRGVRELRRVTGRVELRSKYPLDERSTVVIGLLQSAIKDVRAGKLTIESFDAIAETEEANVMSCDWLIKEYTGRVFYRLTMVRP